MLSVNIMLSVNVLSVNMLSVNMLSVKCYVKCHNKLLRLSQRRSRPANNQVGTSQRPKGGTTGYRGNWDTVSLEVLWNRTSKYSLTLIFGSASGLFQIRAHCFAKPIIRISDSI